MAQDRVRPPAGPPPAGSRSVSADGFWPGYLEFGYFDEAGNLRVEYIERARMEPLARSMAEARLSVTQVRRFFSHCRVIEGQLKARGRSAAALDQLWGAVSSEFVRLDVFAADAVAKQKVPPLFHEFIRRNVAAVKSHDDFLRGFMPHFEALVGFGTAHFSKSERN